jgi:hypothetical protein
MNVFTAASLGEANRMADEWLARRQGVRVLARTKVSVGDTSWWIEDNRWTVTVYDEAESSN